MATTDARAGFRLPWSSERSNSEQTDTEIEPTEGVDESNGARATMDWPTNDTTQSGNQPDEDRPEANDVTDVIDVTDVTDAVEDPAPAVTPAAAARKPSKFMADLTKAMQAAAEEARSLTLSQFQADAKTHVEQIHGRSATEAAALRRTADDDVAAVREWSKAEIARIREETETRITQRKGHLETEIEEHAAVIEREIEAVQRMVASFEDEMASFFERLLAEEDPARFATMAERLPEPPTFEGIVVPAAPVVEVEPTASPVEDVVDDGAEAVAEPELETETTDQADDAAETEPEAAIGEDEAFGADGTDDELPEIDREAAFAAIQAAAEAAASAEVASDAAARAEAVADIAIEIVGPHGQHPEDGETADDPRLDAMGLSPDFAAAEAEAFQGNGSMDDEIPTIEDDALAARIAGLVPAKGDGKPKGDLKSTQVVVVGLVSVASIASFKRHLGRLPGVQGVGVSSGPDGEFVFAVSHGEEVAIRDLVPSIPTFQARVTGSGEGTVNVTAHDPESDG